MALTRRTRIRLVLALRTIAYLVIAASGLAIIVTDYPIFYTVMGWWCLVGGAISAAGAASNRWAGEYMGLPLLTSAMFTFSALTFRDNWPAIQWQSFPSIGLLFAYGVILGWRWFEVMAVGRAAKEQAHVPH